MGFDFLGARKAGYSSKEIVDHLNGSVAFDVDGARSAGYDDDEIAKHLEGLAPSRGALASGAQARGEAIDKVARGIEPLAPNDFAGAVRANRERLGVKDEGYATDRTWGEAASDLGASLVSGGGALAETAGALGGLAVPGVSMDNPVRRAGKSVRETGEGWKSEGLKAREAERRAAIAASDSEWGKFGQAILSTVSDPALLSSFVAEQLPMLIPGMAAGRGVALLTRAAGAGAETALKVGVGTSIGTGAALQGGDVAGNAYDDLLRQPDELWAKNEDYRQFRARGMSHAEAKDSAARSLAREVAAAAGALSVVANLLPGGRAIERALVGAKGKSGRLLGAAKGGVGESVAETIEEGGGKAIGNLAVQQVDPGREISEGVGEASGMGALGGFALGAPAGAISARRGDQRTPPSGAPLPAADVLGIEEPAPVSAVQNQPAAPPLSSPTSTPPVGVVEDRESGMPLADPKAIFEEVTHRPAILSTISQVVEDNASLTQEAKADAAAALRDISADPKELFAVATQRPEVYDTIAKAVAEAARARGASPTLADQASAAPSTPTSPVPAVPAPTQSPKESVGAAFDAADLAAQQQRDRDLDRLAAEASALRQDEALALELGRAEAAGSGLRSATEIGATPMEAALGIARVLGRDPQLVSLGGLRLVADRGSGEARAAAMAEIGRREREHVESSAKRMTSAYAREVSDTDQHVAAMRVLSAPEEARFQRVAADFAARGVEVGRAGAREIGTRERAFATFIEHAFGKKTIFVTADPDKYEGSIQVDDPSTIYANVRAKRPVEAVMAHELFHAMKRTNPKAYRVFMRAIRDSLRIERAAPTYRGYYESKEIDDAVLAQAEVEEMGADISSDMMRALYASRMKSPLFWVGVFTRSDKSLVKKLYDALRISLDIMRMKLRVGERRAGYDTQRFIRDVEAVRRAAARAFEAWQRNEREPGFVQRTVSELRMRGRTAYRVRSLDGEDGAIARIGEGRSLQSKPGKRDFGAFSKELPRTERGKIEGSRGMETRDLWNLVQRMERLAREGRAFKGWYKESAEEILRHFKGDKRAAEIFIQIIAITSANREIKANFTLAEKALMQYVSGEPVDVGSQATNDKINDLLYFGIPWDGRKTNNFYRNIVEQIGGQGSAETTQDMHMGMLAFGRKKLSDPEYSFLDKVTKFVAARMRVTPVEAQVMVWVPQKARHLLRRYKEKGFHAGTSAQGLRRMALAEAAINYGTLARRRWEMLGPEVTNFPKAREVRAQGRQVTAEVKPSTKLELGRALTNMSMAKLQAYQREAFKSVFRDDSPRKLLEAMGLDRTRYRVVDGAGGYDAMMAPNAIVTINAGAATAERVAKAWMYIFRQDAVPFFRADDKLTRSADAAQGVKITFAEPLTNPKLREVYDRLRAQVNPGIGLTKLGPNEIAIVNFRGDDGAPFLMPDAEFLPAMAKALRANDLGVKVSGYVRFGAETAYPYHDWEVDGRGDGLLDSASGPGRPDLSGRLRRWADLFGEFAERRARARRAEERQRGRPRGAGAETTGGQPERAGEARDAGRGDDPRNRIREGWSRQVGERTPVVSFRRGPNPTALVGIHYGITDRLRALDATRFGTGTRSGEASRVSGENLLSVRAYFYAQTRDGVLPESEHVVRVPYVYRALIDNLYDTRRDPDNLIDKYHQIQNSPRASGQHPSNILERMIHEAGYDGYFNDYLGKNMWAAVLIGHPSVPVEYLGDRERAAERLKDEGARSESSLARPTSGPDILLSRPTQRSPSAYRNEYDALLARARKGERVNERPVMHLATPAALLDARYKGKAILGSDTIGAIFGLLRAARGELGAVHDERLRKLPESLNDPKAMYVDSGRPGDVNVVLRHPLGAHHVVAHLREHGNVIEILDVEYMRQETIDGWNRAGLGMKLGGAVADPASKGGESSPVRTAARLARSEEARREPEGGRQAVEQIVSPSRSEGKL